jgi:putrescine transport system substrate-binding protein
VPYLWGTTGIGYNPDAVEKVLGTRTIDSLAAVFDPVVASKLAKCGISWVDGPADMFQAALAYLGLDLNSQHPEDIAAAAALLERARPYVRSIDSLTFVNDLASGEICVAVSWSGAIQEARAAGAQAGTPVEVVYVIPSEGAVLWCDTIAIPTDAPHPDNANAFLDYLMEPDVIAKITNKVRYASGNAAALPYVSNAIRDDPSIYPSAEVMSRLVVNQAFSPQQMREITRAWTRIKTGE